MDDDNTGLRPWAAEWTPGRGYAMDRPSDLDLLPAGLQDETVRRGMFTNVPADSRWQGGGLTLPPWGSQHGTKDTREAWVGRDLVGTYLLMGPGAATQLTDGDKVGWRFAYVEGYNSYKGTHRLVFNLDNLHYPECEVALDGCVLQEWTRPAMRRRFGQV